MLGREKQQRLRSQVVLHVVQVKVRRVHDGRDVLWKLLCDRHVERACNIVRPRNVPEVALEPVVVVARDGKGEVTLHRQVPLVHQGEVLRPQGHQLDAVVWRHELVDPRKRKDPVFPRAAARVSARLVLVLVPGAIRDHLQDVGIQGDVVPEAHEARQLVDRVEDLGVLVIPRHLHNLVQTLVLAGRGALLRDPRFGIVPAPRLRQLRPQGFGNEAAQQREHLLHLRPVVRTASEAQMVGANEAPTEHAQDQRRPVLPPDRAHERHRAVQQHVHRQQKTVVPAPQRWVAQLKGGAAEQRPRGGKDLLPRAALVPRRRQAALGARPLRDRLRDRFPSALQLHLVPRLLPKEPEGLAHRLPVRLHRVAVDEVAQPRTRAADGLQQLQVLRDHPLRALDAVVSHRAALVVGGDERRQDLGEGIVRQVEEPHRGARRGGVGKTWWRRCGGSELEKRAFFFAISHISRLRPLPPYACATTALTRFAA